MSVGYFTKVIASAYKEAVLKDVAAYTQNLRDKADSAGWPEDLVDKLHVDVKDGKFTPTVDKEYKAAVEDLSYGNSTAQPSPVVLNFMRTIGPVS